MMTNTKQVAFGTLILPLLLTAQPNPYRTVEGVWGKLPKGRTWGSTSAVFPATDGSGNIWVGERCGENSCAGKDEPPILLFSSSGKLLKSFGENIEITTSGSPTPKAKMAWAIRYINSAPMVNSS